ncbi:DUF637 domain-containing protein [Vibrio neptunius]|uniref:DUF637 domain-containing protein n=1 Tax=Vibrio neptunius TaxID=170651 RepID=A0ABS3A990_9VIBR|nr:DUF637 domain-containing protein [Vibrio neptunius]MBN3495779.1 DUF637 domain-containing protein [Vibrio neptunius]MBN3518202.1 DUF637 domain-containing protein [Vibrio neptunius]MBN3552532.1 DUF637 domain-containing protein [Vibrio neptunius]MBN3580605.1 DUF637 domain-containing protein [Vibrio neptunius]MCH9874271.1 DUF637 domain-containing protein [Vibrio neptunius]
MNKIKTPLWQKVTSNTLLAAFVTHLSFPVYASVKTNIALEEIKAAVTYTARYNLMESVDQYLYTGALESDELGIFDGFTHFFNLLTTSNPELIPGYSAEMGKPVELTTLPARFGSPYVERGIIRHQISQLLNKSWISKPGYSSYNEQTQKLYENAVEVAKENGFQLGQRLTEQQIAALTRDIVWPEIRTIDGKSYLVPFVYLTPATIQEQQLLESTFAANSAEINTQTFVVNGSRVEFKHDSLIDVEQDFINTQGHISGQKFTIRTGRELQNLSGTITGDDVTLIANKLTNDTLVTRLDYGHGFSETFNQIGTISSLGNLNIYTSGDVVSHGGRFSSQGSLEIEAGGNIILVPQESKNQRAESGERWSDGESSLVNLQTSLSAVDTLSLIAGGEVFIQGAALESQGLLQILAGHGITLKSAADLRSYERKFEAESGGMFGTKESESESATEAEIVRTLLKAGQSMLLSTENGNVLLEAVTIDNKGMSKIIAENGSIDFELAKLLETYSHEQSFEGSLSFRHQGNGYQREVAYYSEFINNGGLLLDGAHGVRIQVAAGSNNLDHTLAELAQTPDLAWMQDIRNNPEYSDVDWQSIELVMEQWDYDQSGLTPAAMAILSIAMAVATGPGGLAIAGPGAGATITISNAALAAAVNAGFGSLVVQTSASLLANGFDVGATMEQIASKESLTSLATTMVTAGVLSGLDIPLFSGENGVELTLEDIVQGAVGAGNELAVQAIMQVVNSTVSTGISSIANGHSFDEFGDAFVQSIAMSAVMHIGKDLATKIGKASRIQDGQTEPDFDTAAKYIAHAALGCGLGTAVSSINGGNSSANKNGCASGAAGGVIGEYVAETYKEHIGYIEGETEKFANKTLRALQKENPLSEIDTATLRQELQRLKTLGVDIARLSAAITVFGFGGNVDIASSTSGNAAEHNVFGYLGYLIGQGLIVVVQAAGAYVTLLTIIELPELFKTAEDFAKAFSSDDEEEREKARQALESAAYEAVKERAQDSIVDRALSLRKWKSAIAAMTSIQLLELLEGEYENLEFTDGVTAVSNIILQVKGNSKAYSRMTDDARVRGSNVTSAGIRKPVEQLTAADFASMYADYKKMAPNGKFGPVEFEKNVKAGWNFSSDRKWHKEITTGYIEKPVYKDTVINGVNTKERLNPIEVCRISDCDSEIKIAVDINGEKKDVGITELGAYRTEAKRVKDLNSEQLTTEQQEAFVKASTEVTQFSHSIGVLAGQAVMQNKLFKVGENGVTEVRKLKADYPGSLQTNDQFDDVFLISYADGREKIFIPEYKGGVNPSDSTRVIDGVRYAQGHYKHSRDTLASMKRFISNASNSGAVAGSRELEEYAFTVQKLTEHYDNVSFVKITTKLNSDGSLKENGTRIQIKEKAFKPDE